MIFDKEGLDRLFNKIFPCRKYVQLDDLRSIPSIFQFLMSSNKSTTSNLELFMNEKLVVDVKSKHRNSKRYMREIVLKTERTDAPVEYAMLYALLENHPPKAAEAILEERIPYGLILKKYGVETERDLQKYFRLKSSEINFFGKIQRLLGFSSSEPYGREYIIKDRKNGAVLTKIVEIFSPNMANYDWCELASFNLQLCGKV